MTHILTTQRLRLEPARADHAELIYQQFSDERLWAFFPELRPNNFAEMKALYRRWEQPAQATEFLENWLCILAQGEVPVGHMQASLLPDKVALIAFILYADHQGKGYAKEGVQAMIEHMRDVHGATKVMMEVDTHHVAAIRLAESIGFTRVAERKGVDRRYGLFGDEYVYELSLSP